MEQFKGYIITENKVPIETYKNKSRDELHSFEAVKNMPEFAGVLEDGYILVDIDSKAESEILLNIVKDLKLDTMVLKTNRGMHFHFKASDRTLTNKTGTYTGIGLKVDMKLGSRNSTAVIKYDNELREVLYNTDSIGEIPIWLTPIDYSYPFLGMKKGDGRNQALFNYILTLQSNEYTKEEARECIRLINKYVMGDGLKDEELEVVLRDEAFQKEIFFGGKNGNKFLFDEFAKYMVSQHKILKINGQLHTYRDGIYINDEYDIEHQMIQYIPTLRQSQRTEVLRYINILIRDNTKPSSANYIAFNNGVYDLVEDEFMDFTDELIITNRIPWNYNPTSYSSVADNTLNKIACYDETIRNIIEEMIGYTFYRRNELGKAFILTGDKSNGKSTLLRMLQNLLGEMNTSSLDLSELDDRFRTVELFGKLANIGDDIGESFIADTSIFKKLVTGESVTVERKGVDAFKINNYSKLLFSANNIPRMSDNTGAVLRRLIIIPFNATFSPTDPDYDPYIRYKLEKPEVMEYLINIGLKGLKRVIENNGFTKSEKVEEELYEYNIQNNPIQVFYDELDKEVDVINQSTAGLYERYVGFCHINYLKPMGRIKFTRSIGDEFGVESVQTRVDGKKHYVFRRIAGKNMDYRKLDH